MERGLIPGFGLKSPGPWVASAWEFCILHPFRVQALGSGFSGFAVYLRSCRRLPPTSVLAQSSCHSRRRAARLPCLVRPSEPATEKCRRALPAQKASATPLLWAPKEPGKPVLWATQQLISIARGSEGWVELDGCEVDRVWGGSKSLGENTAQHFSAA